VVKPFKHKLDTAYMARATFLSDLQIILKCLFRAWGDVALTEMPRWNSLGTARGIEQASTSGGITRALAAPQ
jgi:hypothetical protein